MLDFLKRDKVFTLLFLNAFLVIFGYALAVATGMATVGIMKIVKVVVLLGSMIWVLKERDWRVALNATKHTKLIVSLCLILPVFNLISDDILASFNRTQTFLLPFIYVWISTTILIYRYGQREVLGMFSKMILIVYALPIFSYIVFGGGFSGDSIYGQLDGMVFVSNHFGWSAALFITASLHSAIFVRRSRTTRILIIITNILAIYLLIASGNRTSLLAVGLSLVIVLFYYKGVPVYQKLIIVFAPILLLTYLFSSGNDAVNFIVERSERQQIAGTEPRLERIQIILNRISKNPTLIFTGVGLFNYAAFTKEGEDIDGYHNSYFEILFGLGVPLFLLFMVFMLYEPLKQFIKKVSRFDLVFIPLAIIPFFEGNLTAGQFLFFPWISYIIALNSQRRFLIFGKKNWFLYFDVRCHKGSLKATESI